MARDRQGGQSGPQHQHTPAAPPSTLWDRMAAAGAAKTPADRTNLIGQIVSETAQSGDINPLMECLKDNRPAVQLGAICALVDPDLFPIYSVNAEHLGAVASSISPLMCSSDVAVQLAAAATVQYFFGMPMDDESIRLIREDLAKARANASIGQAIALSFVEDRLP
jgi:hypothetical protein